MNKKVTKDMEGKKVYLIGKDEAGKYQWLEAPSWNCGWYWGFGYIEEYTNHKFPENSRDITSHTHWDSYVVGNQVHHPNDSNSNLIETVLTDKESWNLAELMRSFYILSKTARLFHNGRYCVSTINNFSLKDEELEKHINKDLLPKIFDKINEILTPGKEKGLKMKTKKTIQDLAQEMLDNIEWEKRDNGKGYYTQKHPPKDWITNIVHKAHGQRLPSDDIYEVIVDTLEHIVDTETKEEIEESIREMEPNCYTSNLTKWLNSNNNNVYYLTKALDEFEIKDGFMALSTAQYLWMQDIANSVVDGLKGNM